MRFARVEHFADRAEAVVVHALRESREELSRRRVFPRMHFQPGVDEWADQPRPDCALMISAIAGAQVAGVNWFVIGMVRRKRTKPNWGDEFFLGDIHDRFPARLVKNWMVERDREQLVRSAGRVVRVAAIDIDDVVKMSAFFEPEPAVE